MSDTPDPNPNWKPAPEPGPRPGPSSRGSADAGPRDSRAVWIRGAWMLVLLILFSVAQTLLVATALLQFGWMLFTRQKNPHITEFGSRLGNWMAITARYLAVASEEKPFPWTAWK
ncbi:DUF4389 domain-containing protein [Rhodovulum steppense]|uniref:Uncharacterized protein DUF4389 n=1 Tax=Rhodovulum steppense TaxID=540251 RepID=A0A4R1YU35_9RHOB|nr:DUF4389 domain-containing protein [Rhodovulum steppense]TCM84599.1 uncharacterized protein DUF4389 [Rhodovulum steppense]